MDGKLKKLSKKLEGFSHDHHPCTQVSYQALTKWWNDECFVHHNRCPRCWLRPYDCYCNVLRQKQESYQETINKFQSHVEVCLYYHYLEIGRSANTAHLFEALFPQITKSIVFGNYELETQLFKDIKSDQEAGLERTCILYPTSDALILTDWIKDRPVPPSSSNGDPTPHKPIRIIVLDGTYTQAKKQYKHLLKSMLLHEVRVPVVKLDLGTEGCKSAICGIMYQPGKEKICSYQAIVMALEQLSQGLSPSLPFPLSLPPPSLYPQLQAELEGWLVHMLAQGIKMGKSRVKNLNEVDYSPNPSFQSYLDENRKYLPSHLSSKKPQHKQPLPFLPPTSQPRPKSRPQQTQTRAPPSPTNNPTSLSPLISLTRTALFYAYSLSIPENSTA